MPSAPATNPRPAPIRPATARAACWAVLAAAFAASAISLDRYPRSFIDESFYNYPAIGYLEGKGFLYPVSSSAPHAGRLWAYHSPFFPRLQVATFAALGVSEFSARLPQYVSAYLALALLCEFLIRRGLAGAAVVLAIAWLGDRSSQEVSFGRMEGIGLLCLACGFVGLVRAVERPGWRRGAWCGMALGMAAGFHPVVAPFALASAALIAACAPAGGRRRTLAGFVAGGAVPLALFLWGWSPDLAASLEQFRWNLGMASREPLLARLTRMNAVLLWSRYWPIALALAVVAALVPAAVARLATGRGGAAGDGRGLVWLAACAFAAAGLASVLGGPVLPYYLVYFTAWPVIALAVTPWAGPGGRASRAWIAAFACAVALAWLPSLMWNGLRLREALLHRDQLGHAHFVGQLRRAIPARAEVAGMPLLLMMAKEAGLDYTPLLYYPERAPAPPRSWLLLSREEWQRPQWVAPESLEGRAVVAEGDAFPGRGPFHLDYVILGPARAADGDDAPGPELSARLGPGGGDGPARPGPTGGR